MRRSCTALASPRFELNKRFLNEAFVGVWCTYVDLLGKMMFALQLFDLVFQRFEFNFFSIELFSYLKLYTNKIVEVLIGEMLFFYLIF